jgi:hypothetical protein
MTISCSTLITATPCQSIQAAVDTASPGDTILVAAGTYNEAETKIVGGLGFMTLQADGITIDGIEFVVSGNKRGIAPGGSDGVTIRSGVFTTGGNADRFVFRSVSESTVAAPDQILDFVLADGDRIDLRPIDADGDAGKATRPSRGSASPRRSRGRGGCARWRGLAGPGLSRRMWMPTWR